jgi:glycosyltransferase involved in cell wall biosynthesis
MVYVRKVVGMVDLFVAPSWTVFRTFRDGFGVPEERLAYLDYGFDLARLKGRKRTPEKDFVFGYIGTHIPAKGIPLLLEAFPRVRGKVRLRIWGRPNSGTTPALRERARELPPSHADRVEWMGEYKPQAIVREVFDRVDALVVPSIWLENSPLVIHEAQQARVPVIASNIGGMAEYVNHEVNGLLFRPRNPADLASQMQRFADDPDFAKLLGRHGYLKSESHDIPSIEQHVEDLVAMFAHAMAARNLRVGESNPKKAER